MDSKTVELLDRYMDEDLSLGEGRDVESRLQLVGELEFASALKRERDRLASCFESIPDPPSRMEGTRSEGPSTPREWPVEAWLAGADEGRSGADEGRSGADATEPPDDGRSTATRVWLSWPLRLGSIAAAAVLIFALVRVLSTDDPATTPREPIAPGGPSIARSVEPSLQQVFDEGLVGVRARTSELATVLSAAKVEGRDPDERLAFEPMARTVLRLDVILSGDDALERVRETLAWPGEPAVEAEAVELAALLAHPDGVRFATAALLRAPAATSDEKTMDTLRRLITALRLQIESAPRLVEGIPEDQLEDLADRLTAMAMRSDAGAAPGSDELALTALSALAELPCEAHVDSLVDRLGDSRDGDVIQHVARIVGTYPTAARLRAIVPSLERSIAILEEEPESARGRDALMSLATLLDANPAAIAAIEREDVPSIAELVSTLLALLQARTDDRDLARALAETLVSLSDVPGVFDAMRERTVRDDTLASAILQRWARILERNPHRASEGVRFFLEQARGGAREAVQLKTFVQGIASAAADLGEDHAEAWTLMITECLDRVRSLLRETTPGDSIRRYLVQALDRATIVLEIGEPEAPTFLALATDADEDTRTRFDALVALLRAGTGDPIGVVEQLERQLDAAIADTDADGAGEDTGRSGTRFELSLESLGSAALVHADGVAAALTSRLARFDGATTLAALRALDALGRFPADEDLAALAENPDPDVRRRAHIRRYAETPDDANAERLAAELEDSSTILELGAEVRRAAIRAGVEDASVPVIARWIERLRATDRLTQTELELLDAATASPDPSWRDLAAQRDRIRSRLLEPVRDWLDVRDEAYGRWAAAIRSNDVDEQYRAARAAARFVEGREGVETLLELTTHPKRGIRDAACDQLRCAAPPDIADPCDPEAWRAWLARGRQLPIEAAFRAIDDR